MHPSCRSTRRAQVAEAQLTCAAAQAGMPDRRCRRRRSVTSRSTRSAGSTGTWPPALTDLQRGSVAAARDRLERLVIGDEPNCYAASALALARAADGDADGARALALKVAGLESSTYSDRIMAMLGGGLGQARIGEHDVADAWLRTARELAEGTEDHLLGAVVRVAEARAAAALGPSRRRRRTAPRHRRPAAPWASPSPAGTPPSASPPASPERSWCAWTLGVHGDLDKSRGRA